MAVEACSNRNFMDDMDDEDAPLVFKRKNQSSEAKKLSSRKSDGQTGAQISVSRSAHGEGSGSSEGKTLKSSKTSSGRSPLASPRASTSSPNGSLVKSPGASPRLTSPRVDQTKRSNKGNQECEAHDDSENSEDEKPISARLKSKPNNASTVLDGSRSGETTSIPKQELSDDDDDDEAPLSHKFRKMVPPGEATKKCNHSENEKPVAAKIQENGSASLENSSILLNKRPLADLKSSVQSSTKKLKLSNTSTSSNSKHASGKAPPKTEEDDDDLVPISQRQKLSDNDDDEVTVSQRLKQSGSSANISSSNTSTPSIRKQVSVKASPKTEEDDDDDLIPLSQRRKQSDDDDDVPISQRLKQSASLANKSSALSSTQKLKLSNTSKSSCGRPASVKVRPKAEEDDDDDEVPISQRLKHSATSANKSSIQSPTQELKVSNAPTSSISKQASVKTELKPEEDDYDDDIPISHRLKQSVTSANKSSVQSSTQKLEASNTKMSSNSKQASVKAGPKPKEHDDKVPISQRLKQSAISANKSTSTKKVVKSASSSVKKVNKKSKKIIKKSKYSKSSKVPPSSGEGQKWTTLVHNGVIFPPPYQPHGVRMLYKGKPVELQPDQEEVATMFAVMLDTDYMSKPRFKENFFDDWKKILGKNHVIKNLDDCDFTPIYEWHQREKEKKKQMSSEEKKALKEAKLKQEEKYMWAIVDGVKEKVGNFRVEPPGLFRGRGEHPKMGKLKRRIRPSDITINIGRDAPVPECPIPGERWKEIRHDNTVTWLAYWSDPINPKEFKYVFLAPSSALKGQSDKEKYEKSRLLKDYIEDIRATYTKNFTSKDSTKQQIAVATYLIDKLALRAGNEKDDDEADTVGCCTLKVENVEPLPPNILKFDFLGKDSIRYLNEVPVEPAVFKAIQQFRSGKKNGDDLFDKLDTSKLNAHLKELMPGLTAKVFRTYNASITLDQMLSKQTKDGDVAAKVVVYQHANKEVAIICNHQRTVSKTHGAQMMRLNEKIEELKGVLEELKTDLARAKKGKPPLKNADGKPKRNLNPEALERKIAQTTSKIEKMERDKEVKEDLKTVALGTSKINYMDPRITVAWCKRHEVPIEKIFNKSLLAKFSWAMDVDPNFRF